MCFPVALALLGTAVSAVGTIASAQAAAQQSEYNASVAEINARTARMQSAAQAEKIADEHDRIQGRNRAAAAKAGLNPASGSAALVIEQEGGKQAWLDTVGELWRGATEGTAYDNKAAQERKNAKAQRQAGYFSAASSMLSGAGKAMGSGGLTIS